MKSEQKTENGGVSKLYGTLPPITYTLVSLESTGDAALAEALAAFNGNPEALAKAAIVTLNAGARDAAGGAFLKFLKHARNLIKGGAVPGIELSTVKNEKGEEIVDPKVASIIHALANSMASQVASLSTK